MSNLPKPKKEAKPKKARNTLKKVANDKSLVNGNNVRKFVNKYAAQKGYKGLSLRPNALGVLTESLNAKIGANVEYLNKLKTIDNVQSGGVPFVTITRTQNFLDKRGVKLNQKASNITKKLNSKISGALKCMVNHELVRLDHKDVGKVKNQGKLRKVEKSDYFNITKNDIAEGLDQCWAHQKTTSRKENIAAQHTKIKRGAYILKNYY